MGPGLNTSKTLTALSDSLGQHSSPHSLLQADAPQRVRAKLQGCPQRVGLGPEKPSSRWGTGLQSCINRIIWHSGVEQVCLNQMNLQVPEGQTNTVCGCTLEVCVPLFA